MKTIWICGHRKSGTTLLSNLLDGHALINSYGSDLKLIYAFYNVYEKIPKSTLKKRLIEILLDDRVQDSFLNAESANKIISECDVSSNGCIWNILKEIKKLTPKNKYFLVKETSSELNYDIIRDNEDPIFLHMIRDPRDNYAAIKAGVTKYYSLLGEDTFASLASTINRINFGFTALKTNLERSKSYNYIKFENLVQNSEQEIKKICQILKIEFDDSLLLPTKEGKVYAGNSHDGKKFSNISKDNLNKFSKRITDWEISVIEYFCRDMMEFFDYPFTMSDETKAYSASDFYRIYNSKYFYYDKFKQI